MGDGRQIDDALDERDRERASPTTIFLIYCMSAVLAGLVVAVVAYLAIDMLRHQLP